MCSGYDLCQRIVDQLLIDPKLDFNIFTPGTLKSRSNQQYVQCTFGDHSLLLADIIYM